MAGKGSLLASTSMGSLDASTTGTVWDPSGKLPGIPGGTAYRDAAPMNRIGRPFNVAFLLSSANQEIIRERRSAVANAREADRNNTMVSAGLTKRATDMVGKQLRLQALPNFTALGLNEDWAGTFAQEWENLFSLWGESPRKINDATRHSTFGAQMFETCRNTYGADGEATLIVRYDERRAARLRSKWATFVEVVDPDRLSNPDGKPDDENLCQGRELDEYGAYTRLWFERHHPAESHGPRKWDPVERETDRGRPVGIHWFPRFRAGAQRAMPAILGSLRDVRMLDTFDQKTLEAAVKDAFMSIVIKTDATSAEALAKIQGTPTGDANALLQSMDTRFALYEDFNAEGQAIPVLLPGDSIDINTASHAANNTDSFRFAFERKFASRLGLSYARFSNDYSKTSFASIRAELIDAWRMTYADRYEFCVSVPSLIAMAHLEECIITGRIVLPAGAPPFYENWDEYAQCEWRGPGMGWVDPVKDVTGAGLRVNGGMSNPQLEAASQGTDFYDNIDATARAQAYAKRKGVELQFGNKGNMPAQQLDENGNPVDPNADPAEDAEDEEDDATDQPGNTPAKENA